MLKPHLLFVFLLGFCFQLFGQNTEILPSIVVIPRINSTEHIKTKIENNPSIRVGIAAIKKGFDEYGYVTKDFESLSAKTNLQDYITKHHISDIVVELDIIFDKHSSGNSVRIILEAFEVTTSNSLSSITCESNKFYTEDVSILTLNAMSQKGNNELSCFDNFMKDILVSWNNQYEKGKNAIIQFTVGPNSKFTMNSKIKVKNDERLKFIIEDWLIETAFDNYAKISSSTEHKILVDEYRYPYLETVRKIERNLYKLFDGLGLEVKIESKRDAISVTVL